MKLSDIPGVQIRASQALKEISAITDSLLGANTLLVLNSFRVAHLAALGQWFARYTGQKFAPTVILLLTIELLRETASTNSTLEREQLKAAFRPFQCDALKVRLGVPSNLIANEMRQISGLAPVVCPTPHIFPRQVTNMGRPPQPAAGGIRIAVLGTARNEKGFPLLPGIVTQTLSSRSDASFVIQVCPGADPLGETLARLEKISRQSDRCRLIDGALSATNFYELMCQSGIVLLPYSAARYSWRGSNIFSEALAAGIPTVVPDNTWMAEMISTYDSGGAIEQRGGRACPAVRSLRLRPRRVERGGYPGI
jgi:hypothetical protein